MQALPWKWAFKDTPESNQVTQLNFGQAVTAATTWLGQPSHPAGGARAAMPYMLLCKTLILAASFAFEVRQQAWNTHTEHVLYGYCMSFEDASWCFGQACPSTWQMVSGCDDPTFGVWLRPVS